jgi:diadenylate cyclase
VSEAVEVRVCEYGFHMQPLDALNNLIGRLKWSDLVELLLIGIVVFVVMRFLRGTRGARLLRGFIFLLVGSSLIVSLVANVFDLERIRFLYPLFVGALFLVALVAFQPELRRALIHLGAATWFSSVAQEMDRVIDETVDAVGYLARNKIGALIAFERSTEFGGMIDSACRLDAEVSRQLLLTIFWPGSALHDMGVIISQGRIAAAAVQFPLTESEDLDPSLGSRHRAALGLSQESDALVIVVSEETGTISVVDGGRMERFLTPVSLREQLSRRLAVESEAAPAEAAPARSPS